MNDLPPIQEKIVIVRKHRELAQEVHFSKDLWCQMNFQMALHELDLEQFVTYAIELYVDELIKRENQEKKWIDYGDGQHFTTQPIDIKQKSSSDSEDIFKAFK